MSGQHTREVHQSTSKAATDFPKVWWPDSWSFQPQSPRPRTSFPPFYSHPSRVLFFICVMLCARCQSVLVFLPDQGTVQSDGATDGSINVFCVFHKSPWTSLLLEIIRGYWWVDGVQWVVSLSVQVCLIQFSIYGHSHACNVSHSFCGYYIPAFPLSSVCMCVKVQPNHRP